MKMTARQLFKKVPKYGLFLFECDNKTDICKSTQISDDKDNITEGRTVTVLYGRDCLMPRGGATDELLPLSPAVSIVTCFFDAAGGRYS